MTARRTRLRPRRSESALADIPAYAKPRDVLNEASPGVTRCAWPRCREPLVYSWTHLDEGTAKRYGVLCETHAIDVAIAVVQHQRDVRRMEEFFEQQTTERAVRFEEMRREDERYEAEKAALRQDKPGFVYYLRVGERVKIGYSVDVKRRMRAYPPGSELLAVEPGDRDAETQRHRQFAGSLLDGREWFRPTPDLLEHIERTVAEHGDPKRHAHHYRRKTEPLRIKRSA